MKLTDTFANGIYTVPQGFFRNVPFRYTKKRLCNILEHMELFAMGYSWGGVESLPTPLSCSQHRTASEWNPGMLVPGYWWASDLKKDWEQAFTQLKQDC